MADYEVARSVSINAAPSEVFKHLNDYHHWGEWSPWDEMDPAMSKTYTGEVGEIGSGYQWSGNRKVGEGRMTTTSIDEPNQLDINLEFIKPFKSVCQTSFAIKPESDASHVTWRMTGQHTLMSRIMGIFKSMDAMVGPDFEKGLAKLKQVAEAEA